MTPGRHPDFYIVGAQKCGTTALYSLLRQHKDVFLPHLKESHFFALGGARPHPQITTVKKLNTKVIWNEVDYLELFSGAKERICGEVCSTYLYAKDAALEIAEKRPDAKIVILLRNPVDRSFSAYNHMRARGVEHLSTFESAVAGDAKPIGTEWLAMAPYKDGSRYAAQVKRYLTAFGLDQVLIIKFDDFILDPISVANEVLKFIGLQPLNDDVKLEQINKTHIIYNPLVRQILINQRFGIKTLRRLLPARIRGRLREHLVAKFAAPQGLISDDIKDRLTQEFLPDILELEALTGLSFEDWKR